ncbi:MAG TPA: saccharopine dehydrogenase C-terminal domain-containing protein [Pyrinomonadaceae bacterium]|nr:saccharopine dehydrogenase C-terminal domain-containing protein [Pyrinomonadaceae bacterium]
MKILVLGAGRMGHGAVFDLVRNSPAVDGVTVADADLAKAQAVAAHFPANEVTAVAFDAADETAAAELMRGHDAVISCVNYWYNVSLSRAAIAAGANFCDLGGNNTIVDQQLALDSEARNAGVNIIPDCGLAPGMVSILAELAVSRLDSAESVRIRVGGLPQKPEPPLDYQLVFSVEGLINEYLEPARVIRDGKIVEVGSMTELEELAFEGFPPLEAFQTSGGTSTLPDTFLGKLRELDYKTIRYAGHCEKFKTMIDLGLCSSAAVAVGDANVVPRKVFGKLLEMNLPADGPDYVLVRVEAAGEKDGKRRTVRFEIVDSLDAENNISAMMRTTAFPASIIAQMMADGRVRSRGSVPQEKAIDPEVFLAELRRRGINVRESGD